MNHYQRITFLWSLVAMFSGYACADMLNPAQRLYLNTLIRLQVRDASDRSVIGGWTEAQRVAEFVCRPLALKVVKKQFAGVDKVILNQGPDNKQHLESSVLLIGNGQYRSENGWISFNYQCVLSQKSGKAERFSIMKNTQVLAPGPVLHSSVVRP